MGEIPVFSSVCLLSTPSGRHLRHKKGKGAGIPHLGGSQEQLWWRALAVTPEAEEDRKNVQSKRVGRVGKDR